MENNDLIAPWLGATDQMINVCVRSLGESMHDGMQVASGRVVRAMVDLGKTVRSSKWGLRWLGTDVGGQRQKRLNVCEVIRNPEVEEGRRV